MAATPLTDDEVRDALGALDDWTLEDGRALRRVFSAEDFPAAIHLVNVVAILAEQQNHHPDIDIRYRTVTFTLSSHDAGGKVTRKDVELATQIDSAIATRPSAR